MGRMQKTPLADSGFLETTLRPETRGGSQVFDSACVDLEDWNSRQFWSDRLGLTHAQLGRLVRVVGTSVTRIEDHLESRRQRRLQRRRSAAKA